MRALGQTILAAAPSIIAVVLFSGLNVPHAHEELVVTNFTHNSVTVYPRAASGNAAPIRTLVGPATGLNAPLGVVQDFIHDELVVANNFGLSVTVYPRTASGNVSPSRTLT